MSVYQSTKSRFYQYDFQFKGKRFHGSTGVEGKREAETFERNLRTKVALGTFDPDEGLTLDHAAARWWEEVGSRLRTKADLERRLTTLITIIGRNVLLTQINTRVVSQAIERRRSQTFTKGLDREGRPAKRYPVSNATVNADIISPLRRILRRAETVWEVKGLAKINWRALTLPEPEPKIRIYTPEQQAAWRNECDPVTRFALDLLLRYGLRLGELFFRPDDFDASGPRVVINNRKCGPHMLPLRQDDGREVSARVGRAKAAGLSHIFFEEVIQPHGTSTRETVTPVSLTYYGLQSRLRSAAKRAGINLSRVIHGTRHHAGTVMLGKTGNLKLTQQLLGHADIKSTLRYAHALEGDLRHALEDHQRPSHQPPPFPRNAKVLGPKA